MDILGSGIQRYQRLVLMCLTVLFIVYGMILNMPLYAIITLAALIVIGIINPYKVCRPIPIPLSRRIFVNYCGFMLPLKISMMPIFFNGVGIEIPYLILLISSSMMLASLHTYITKNMILVNVVRYCISLIALSIIMTITDTLPYLLPFVTVTGLFLGSDFLPYIIFTKIRRNNEKVVVIGGFAALDSIVLALILVLTVVIAYSLIKL